MPDEQLSRDIATVGDLSQVPAPDNAVAKARDGVSEFEFMETFTTESAPGRLITDLRLHAGEYATVYADPPWAYGDKSCAGGVGAQYETASIDDMCGWSDIPALAHPDGCHLWMWTTWPMVRDKAAHKLLEAWGFGWKGEIVWLKPGMGVGRWLRPSTELLVLGVRGKLPLLRKNILGHCIEENRQGHSIKPHAFREIVESASPGPRIELFSRLAVHGWDRWGYDA